MNPNDILAEARRKLDAASPAEIDRVLDSPFIKKIASSLERFDHEDRKVVLDEIISAVVSGGDPADRLELLARLTALRLRKHPELADKPAAAMSLDQALESAGLLSVVESLERRTKALVLPDPSTAQNLETLMMSYGYWMGGVVRSEAWSQVEEVECALAGALLRSPESVDRVRRKFECFSLSPDAAEHLTFATVWFQSAFARLEVGHKLAASLCLTDIPDDVEVRAPWSAWSLVVPDGLLGALARVWCIGTKPVFVVTRAGVIHRAVTAESSEHSANIMLRALVRSACLALSNPDEFRKERRHGPSARAAHKGRHGPPDLEQARFLLSAPVKVDLREQVAAALSGSGHGSPTVQFLVRGHWRNQAHGPKHALRKTIWVEPFWKGPEESRILLRQHQVEEPQKTPD